MFNLVLVLASVIQTQQDHAVERRIRMAQEAEARLVRMQHREVEHVQPTFRLSAEEERMNLQAQVARLVVKP